MNGDMGKRITVSDGFPNKSVSRKQRVPDGLRSYRGNEETETDMSQSEVN